MGVKSRLGSNPLSQSIFTKTADDCGDANAEPTTSSQEKRIKKKHSSKKKTAPRKAKAQPSKRFEFLASPRKENINLRIPTRLNDWLDALIKHGRRQHGRKIAKEVWAQAALEFFQELPVDWRATANEDELKAKLSSLLSEIKKLEQDDAS